MTLQRILTTLLLVAVLTSCAPAPTADLPASTLTSVPASTETITPTTLPTLTPVPTATLPAMDDFMKGLVYYPAGWGGDQRPETEWMLRNIVLPTGANWIRLHVACNQDSVTSTQVYCDPQQALSDEAYIHLVKTAHSLGLRVMSEHYINSVGWDGYWAGDIGDKYNEQQWTEWFSSYGAMVLHYAELAEAAGTDYIIISSELDSTTRRETEWRELIAKVREVYHGKVSMAYSDEHALEEVQFWDALDAITIHPYYLDLPGVIDPTVEQLTKEFTPYADRLGALSKKWDRPILITEIGFWSVHTMSQNYNNLDSSTQIDLQEQSDLFQAVFNAFYGKEWLDGIFWYAFSGIANYAEPWNSHNDYIGKPAENVIRSFYGAAPMPTATPVIFPDASFTKTEVIYDDELNPDWSNYPPEGDPANVQFDQSDIAVSGNAIKAKLLTFWTLDFSNDNVDWKNYQWLEFDLYVEPQTTPKFYTIGLSLRDSIYQSTIYKLELLQSQFIQGGRIEPGTWQHVEVPLDVFGPLLSDYGIISIDRPPAGRENRPLTIYVDNVILRGALPEISSNDQGLVPATLVANNTGTINHVYDDFNNPQYDGSFNQLLWSVDLPTNTAQAIQQDGVLTISDKDDSIGQGIILSLINWRKATFGFVEARVMAHYEPGSNGNVTLDAISPAIPRGWTEMGLTPRLNGANFHVLDLSETRLLNDTWYMLRIEFDAEQNALTYFLDGEQVATEIIPNKVLRLDPAIQLWHPDGYFVTGYFDYVAIGD